MEKGVSMLRGRSLRENGLFFRENPREIGFRRRRRYPNKKTNFSAENVWEKGGVRCCGGNLDERRSISRETRETRGSNISTMRGESRGGDKTRLSVSAPRRQSKQKTECPLEEISGPTGLRGKSQRQWTTCFRRNSRKRGPDAADEILTTNGLLR